MLTDYRGLLSMFTSHCWQWQHCRNVQYFLICKWSLHSCKCTHYSADPVIYNWAHLFCDRKSEQLYNSDRQLLWSIVIQKFCLLFLSWGASFMANQLSVRVFWCWVDFLWCVRAHFCMDIMSCLFFCERKILIRKSHLFQQPYTCYCY